MSRRATVVRKTRETNIRLSLNLDGRGKTRAKTTIGFLNHMLDVIGTHGLFDITVTAKGDTDVDIHHVSEDVGRVLGQAICEALGDHKGINRYGWSYVPMEESPARVVLDISGRPKVIIRDQRKPAKKLKGAGTPYQWFDVEHFVESVARTARLTIHVDIFAGDDFHHTAEAICKALGKALRQATRLDSARKGVPSSKGQL